ncbi:TPA: MFS transporter [Streptococcus suis]|nr:MFS transporter [Streptococcus suis]
MKNKQENWRMSRKERLNYYLADSGRMFGTMIFQTYMTAFLALRGVNLSVLAGLLLILKLIDAFNDILFGFWVDKIQLSQIKRLKRIVGDGKYLPWFKLTFFLFPLFTIVFYSMPNSLPDWAKLAWFIVSYLFYDFSCTLIETPMSSLVLTLTDVTDERNRILTVRGIVTVIAVVLLSIVSTLLVDPKVGLGLTFSKSAILLVSVCLIMMLPLVKNGKEYNLKLKNTELEENETYTLKDMWNCVKVNKYMAIFLSSSLIIGVTATATAVGSLASFYLFDGNTAIVQLPLLLAFIPGILISSQGDKIAKKFGRKNSIVGLSFFFGTTFILQYFLGYKNLVIFITLGVLAGLANSLRYVFQNFIAPDTIEYTRYKTGKDCSGIFYALNSFVNKATNGIGASIGLLILGLFGWNEIKAGSYQELLEMGTKFGEAAYQTPQAIHGMWVVYTLIPGIGFILAAITLMFYKLDDRDAELMAKCNSGEITRQECEQQLSKTY